MKNQLKTSADLKNMSVAQLKSEAEMLHRQIFDLKQQRMSGKITNTSIFGNLRKQIARVYTFAREKEVSKSE